MWWWTLTTSDVRVPSSPAPCCRAGAATQRPTSVRTVILGLAQIVIEVDDFEASVAQAEQQGWQVAFAEDVVIPEPVAAGYPAPTRDVATAILRRDGAVPVEVTRHRRSVAPPEGALTVTWPSSTGVTDASSSWDSGDHAAAFWNVLAPDCVHDDNECLTVVLDTPFRTAQLRLTLRRAAPRSGRIDGRGGAALAFVSTSVDADLDLLVSCGAEARSDVGFVHVDGAKVEVAFAIAPGGIPIELVCVS